MRSSCSRIAFWSVSLQRLRGMTFTSKLRNEITPRPPASELVDTCYILGPTNALCYSSAIDGGGGFASSFNASSLSAAQGSNKMKPINSILHATTARNQALANDNTMNLKQLFVAVSAALLFLAVERQMRASRKRIQAPWPA